MTAQIYAKLLVKVLLSRINGDAPRYDKVQFRRRLEVRGQGWLFGLEVALGLNEIESSRADRFRKLQFAFVTSVLSCPFGQWI